MSYANYKKTQEFILFTKRIKRFAHSVCNQFQIPKKDLHKKKIQKKINQFNLPEVWMIKMLQEKGFQFNREVFNRHFNYYLPLEELMWVNDTDIHFFVHGGAKLYRKNMFNVLDSRNNVFELSIKYGYDFFKHHHHLLRPSFINRLFDSRNDKKKYFKLRRVLSIVPFQMSYYKKLKALYNKATKQREVAIQYEGTTDQRDPLPDPNMEKDQQKFQELNKCWEFYQNIFSNMDNKISHN